MDTLWVTSRVKPDLISNKIKINLLYRGLDKGGFGKNSFTHLIITFLNKMSINKNFVRFNYKIRKDHSKNKFTIQMLKIIILFLSLEL